MSPQNIINYPPEVLALLVHCKSINNAEITAGLANGTFGKLRDGKRAYTELTKQKVLTALDNFTRKQEDKLPMPIPHAVIPASCPPLIADLIKHVGSRYQARRALSCSEATLKKIIEGKAELTPIWIERAKAALARAATLAPEGPAHLRAAMNAHPFAPKPDLPEFAPWDRKTFGEIAILRGGKKVRTQKKVPMPIVALFNKMGSMADAGRAIGYSPGWLQNFIDNKREMNLKLQNKIHAAMHGQVPSSGEGVGEQFDEYRLDMAIVLTKAQNYDRIADMAEILNGKLLFKKSTTAGWIFIYSIKGDDARRFKKLAMRDAQEIVCP